MVCVCLFSYVLVVSPSQFSGDNILTDRTHYQSAPNAGDALVFPSALCSLTDFCFLSSVGSYNNFPLNREYGLTCFQ